MIITIELLPEAARNLVWLIKCVAPQTNYWRNLAEHIEQSINDDLDITEEAEHGRALQTAN